MSLFYKRKKVKAKVKINLSRSPIPFPYLGRLPSYHKQILALQNLRRGKKQQVEESWRRNMTCDALSEPLKSVFVCLCFQAVRFLAFHDLFSGFFDLKGGRVNDRVLSGENNGSIL